MIDFCQPSQILAICYSYTYSYNSYAELHISKINVAGFVTHAPPIFHFIATEIIKPIVNQ